MIGKLLLALLLSCGSAFAACHVSTPAGSGTRDGSNWNNAFAGLPATLVRGDTYYIASGTYAGGYRFNTPLLGTSLVTVKKAMATDHCTDVGWDAALDAGQAVWTTAGVTGAIWQFTDPGSSYWLIDGQSRDTLKSGHGFKLDNSAPTRPNAINLISNTKTTPIETVTFRYVEIAGPGITAGSPTLYEFDFRYAGYVNHLVFEYGYIHDTSDTPIQNDGTRPCNVTIQYSVIARNGANFGHHSEAFADGGSCQADSIDPTGKTSINHNVFEDIQGTGFIVSVNTSATTPTNNLEVSRNVFMWHQGNPYHLSGLGNGVVTTTSNSTANNWTVSWNTFVNLPPGAGANILSTANITGGSGFTALNNLCYYPSGIVCGFSPSPAAQITSSGTIVQTASPFVDWLGEDYHLKIPLNAGAFDYGAAPVPTPTPRPAGGLNGTFTCAPFPTGGWDCTLTIKPN